MKRNRIPFNQLKKAIKDSPFLAAILRERIEAIMHFDKNMKRQFGYLGYGSSKARGNNYGAR